MVGNDSLQTLGTFLGSNRGRTPPAAQMAFLVGLTAVVLGLGWWLNGGDPAWGRLARFPLPEEPSWVDLLPPLVVLLLTRWGAPVSTSVLLLTAIAPANLAPVLFRSLAGYGLAFASALLLYGALLWLLESPPPAAAAPRNGPLWLALQWLSTAWLWSQWLVQDLANIYVHAAPPARMPGSWRCRPRCSGLASASWWPGRWPGPAAGARHDQQRPICAPPP